ncbi:MAG: c-type cytochrome, partial [Actinomycetota bacterium]
PRGTTMLVKVMTAAVALGVFAASQAVAADGKALFADKGCTACHGEDAKTPLQEGYPKLAGQNAAYVVQQLKDMKSGARANGLVADTMKPVAEDLDEASMTAIAEWLATLRPANIAAEAGPAGDGKTLYLKKTCIACHGKEGNKPVMPFYPLVGGQEKGYLLQQLKDIKSTARKNGKVDAMAPVMHLVADNELEAIAGYLSQVK